MSIEINEQLPAPQTAVFARAEDVADSVAQKLLDVIFETVEADGVAHISLTGGGPGIATLKSAARLLQQKSTGRIDWSAVHIWWGDERLLPLEDADRNEQQAQQALLGTLVTDYGLPEENIHRMPASEDAANPEAGAQMYARELEAYSPEGGINGMTMPPLAVMLLGVGPDGHINSLFPHKAALQVQGQTTVGEEQAPAELGPPLRVSLTFDAIHTARRVWLVTAGESKVDAVRKAFQDHISVEEIPARNARGAQETVWHLDQAAAAGL